MEMAGHDIAIVFFPYNPGMLCCGLAGIVSFKKKKTEKNKIDVLFLKHMVADLAEHSFYNDKKKKSPHEKSNTEDIQSIDSLVKAVRALKKNSVFFEIYDNEEIQSELFDLKNRIEKITDSESKFLCSNSGILEASEVESVTRRIEDLKDISWCLSSELADNIIKIRGLYPPPANPLDYSSLMIFKEINSVLNSIDCLEVRGRDSAGISLMFIIEKEWYDKFRETLPVAENCESFTDDWKKRTGRDVLVNKGISIDEKKDNTGNNIVALSIAYKFAAEIGSLGDNVNFLRKQIKNDYILHHLLKFPLKYHTITAHTRWASVGAISESNCHPVDNKTARKKNKGQNEIIHVCLNGDIDNYQELKAGLKQNGNTIPDEITTDTKIIPLQIEKYIRIGYDIEEAFRLAVNDFKGSHAISMHTDLAPGKLFLAQKGSGQAVFIGISNDYYMPASEIYGFIEETTNFLKIDGEKEIQGKNGKTNGQIFILNQDTDGGLNGIKAAYYDGTPLKLTEADIKHSEITSRDINRQGFDHYFLKEISESPISVEKTLLNRWKINENKGKRYTLSLDENVFPLSLQNAFMDLPENEKQINRIFFVGQGTAGVAAQACSDILNYYLADISFYVGALKASELSGFTLSDSDASNLMDETLVIAISQSGTTTDTNRTIEMVKARGAHTLAIVNRRDSDLTFKVDGVMYTSSGRDIEMSVASTKAFYSQIVAGALLSLNIARLKNRRDDRFVDQEIRNLLEIPSHMEKVLGMKDKIAVSAETIAPSKIYWAVVGSGPNKVSADEIRIKLSELCYKTISSDYIEDKKHIDLSSEPLIVVCAAGTRGNVIGDIIKDTAIFHAHKATTVVIADEGENGFEPFAVNVFHVPVVSKHLAPILNTLVGHIWGYYAALAINEGSKCLYNFREEIQNTIDENLKTGLDIYEIILEKFFREKIARFYTDFRSKKIENILRTSSANASDITLLLKYLSGRIPVTDFEIDFGKKGTALNMLETMFECLGEAINSMSRPVDAIKHQAKTVTVGTSRISEKLEGLLFDALSSYGFNISQVSNKNIIVLKNLQKIIERINGTILYKISGLTLLGEPADGARIEIIKKDGILKQLPSRVERDTKLKGTKKIIVEKGNVFIGMGRMDDRSFLVVPLSSNAPDMLNMIEYLFLLNIAFFDKIPLGAKIAALGGKYDHIKNIVLENLATWEDHYLELIQVRRLFGRSAEKIGEAIVANLR